MTRAMAMVGAVLAMAGCAGEPPTMAEQLEGAWSYEGADGCTQGLTFGLDAFELARVCARADGAGYGIEVRTGRWTLTGAQLALVVDASTCAAFEPSQTVRITLQADTLRVVSETRSEVYERVEGDQGGSGAAEFGCFGSAGFEPRALTAN